MMYHSISDRPAPNGIRSCLELIGMDVSRDRFERHMEYVFKRYQVVGLDDLTAFMSSGKPLPANSIVITFDDGFYETFVNALPILNKFCFKATFFIIGNTQLREGVVWLHRLYQILDERSGRSFQYIEDNRPLIKVNHIDEGGKLRLADFLKTRIRMAREPHRMNMLKEICAQNEIDWEGLRNRDIFMSAEQLKELAAHGHMLGAHSMTHSNLMDLPRERRTREILESRDMVLKITPGVFIPFSYPHGTMHAFDEELKRMLNENGLTCAVTTLEGLNDRYTDPYEIRRIEIGNFTVTRLATHLSGIIGGMKTKVKKIAR